MIVLEDKLYTGSNKPQRKFGSLSHHHLDELLVIDLPVTIDVSLPNHLVDLLVGQLLAQIGHNVTQFRRTDESVPVTIEHLESLDELLLGVGVFHLPGHKGQELGEINGAVSIGVNLVD